MRAIDCKIIILVIILTSVFTLSVSGKKVQNHKSISFGSVLIPEKQIKESIKLTKQQLNSNSPVWRAKGDQKRFYRFTEAGQNIPYRVCVPSDWDGKSKLPLVMFLHGGWNDESSYLDQNDGQLVKLAQKHKCLLVSPLGYKGAYGNSLLLPAVFGKPELCQKVLASRTRARDSLNILSEKDVINVLELVLNEYPVDRKSMFLIGHSMGSGGAWYIGAKYSKYWKGLAPMSGPFVTEKGYPWKNLRNKVIYISEGLRATASLEASRELYSWLDNSGFSVEYKEVDADHPGMVPLILPSVFDFIDRNCSR